MKDLIKITIRVKEDVVDMMDALKGIHPKVDAALDIPKGNVKLKVSMKDTLTNRMILRETYNIYGDGLRMVMRLIELGNIQPDIEIEKSIS